MIYYSFNEPALNGFTPILETKYQHHPLYHLIEKIPVSVRSLKSLLDEYLPANTNIDFLSIDVEGLDLEVLLSNDWTKYVPHIILVECWKSTIENILKNPIYLFLAQKDYEIIAKTINTLIFKRKSQC